MYRLTPPELRLDFQSSMPDQKQVTQLVTESMRRINRLDEERTQGRTNHTVEEVAQMWAFLPRPDDIADTELRTEFADARRRLLTCFSGHQLLKALPFLSKEEKLALVDMHFPVDDLLYKEFSLPEENTDFEITATGEKMDIISGLFSLAKGKEKPPEIPTYHSVTPSEVTYSEKARKVAAIANLSGPGTVLANTRLWFEEMAHYVQPGMGSVTGMFVNRMKLLIDERGHDGGYYLETNARIGPEDTFKSLRFRVYPPMNFNDMGLNEFRMPQLFVPKIVLREPLDRDTFDAVVNHFQRHFPNTTFIIAFDAQVNKHVPEEMKTVLVHPQLKEPGV